MKLTNGGDCIDVLKRSHNVIVIQISTRDDDYGVRTENIVENRRVINHRRGGCYGVYVTLE